MYTNNASAFGTSPSHLFISNKSSYSKFSYVLKIFNHAHTVSGSISLVQMFQIDTRKLVTLKTIFRFVLLKSHTVFYLASSNGDRFSDVNSSATRAFIFLPEICHTYTAVHSTWGD